MILKISLANKHSDVPGAEKDAKKAFHIYYKLTAKVTVEKNEEKAFELYLKSAKEDF
ncbi:hypothetical protein Glove_228g94 [Diversispora epigaea]|uniref:Uncharacterized protein n=1 Tax=Diversispora epigaea TaxID=1348612 RepID=A0A397IHY9_9GLOM|nr:hypothetical protein Glove_228g94 [Diversispora epigaea]